MDPNESKICVFENVSDLYIFVSLSIVCVIFSTWLVIRQNQTTSWSKVVANASIWRWLGFNICLSFCRYAFKFNLVIKVAVSRFVRRLRKGDWFRECWRYVTCNGGACPSIIKKMAWCEAVRQKILTLLFMLVRMIASCEQSNLRVIISWIQMLANWFIEKRSKPHFLQQYANYKRQYSPHQSKPARTVSPAKNKLIILLALWTIAPQSKSHISWRFPLSGPSLMLHVGFSQLCILRYENFSVKFPNFLLQSISTPDRFRGTNDCLLSLSAVLILLNFRINY